MPPRPRTPAAHANTSGLLGVLTLVAGVAVVFGAAGCASASPSNPGGLPTDRISQIGELCVGVMGTEQGDERYNACVESLSSSSSNIARGRGLENAREQCAREGLRPGGADMATCMVERSDSAGPTYARAEGPGPEPGYKQSYAYATNAEIHHREQLSCAGLGLDPSGRAFAECVGGLDSALFDADNPMQ